MNAEHISLPVSSSLRKLPQVGGNGKEGVGNPVLARACLLLELNAKLLTLLPLTDMSVKRAGVIQAGAIDDAAVCHGGVQFTSELGKLLGRSRLLILNRSKLSVWNEVCNAYTIACSLRVCVYVCVLLLFRSTCCCHLRLLLIPLCGQVRQSMSTTSRVKFLR